MRKEANFSRLFVYCGTSKEAIKRQTALKVTISAEGSASGVSKRIIAFTSADCLHSNGILLRPNRKQIRTAVDLNARMIPLEIS